MSTVPLCDINVLNFKDKSKQINNTNNYGSNTYNEKLVHVIHTEAA